MSLWNKLNDFKSQKCKQDNYGNSSRLNRHVIISLFNIVIISPFKYFKENHSLICSIVTVFSALIALAALVIAILPLVKPSQYQATQKVDMYMEQKAVSKNISPSVVPAPAKNLSPVKKVLHPRMTKRQDISTKPNFVANLDNGLVEVKDINWGVGNNHEMLIIKYEVIADIVNPNSSKIIIASFDELGGTKYLHEEFPGVTQRKGEVKDAIIRLPISATKVVVNFK